MSILIILAVMLQLWASVCHLWIFRYLTKRQGYKFKFLFFLLYSVAFGLMAIRQFMIFYKMPEGLSEELHQISAPLITSLLLALASTGSVLFINSTIRRVHGGRDG